MRRSLVVSLALLAMVESPAVAQTCLGLASFSTGNMQVSGNGQFTNGSNRFGAGFNYGLPASVFAGAQISTTSFDGASSSSLGVGANVGYQMSVGKAANIHVCPTASLELGNGPDATGINGSSRAANVGFSMGTTMGANPRMKILPTAGLGLAYSKLKLDDGTTTTELSDTYGQARLGVGFIFNQQIAVRPSVDIPLGLQNSDPTFGLTVAYSFGSSSRPAPARKR